MKTFVGAAAAVLLAASTNVATAYDGDGLKEGSVVFIEDKANPEYYADCVYEIVAAIDTHIVVKTYWCGNKVFTDSKSRIVKRSVVELKDASQLLRAAGVWSEK